MLPGVTTARTRASSSSSFSSAISDTRSLILVQNLILSPDSTTISTQQTPCNTAARGCHKMLCRPCSGGHALSMASMGQRGAKGEGQRKGKKRQCLSLKQALIRGWGRTWAMPAKTISGTVTGVMSP